MAATAVRAGVTKPSSFFSSSNGVLRARPFALGISKILLMGLSSVVSAAPISVFQQDDDGQEQGASLWVLYAASIVLVLLGGAFAGLTIAYVLCYISWAQRLFTGNCHDVQKRTSTNL